MTETRHWVDSGVIPPDGGERILGDALDVYAENREPRLVHPSWLEAAEAKLAALEKKTGRKPNLLVYILDDVGWGDFGCYGGGHLRGAPTPQQAARQFLDFAGDSILVGHNVGFDLGFLEEALAEGFRFDYGTYLDTLTLTREAYPDL